MNLEQNKMNLRFFSRTLLSVLCLVVITIFVVFLWLGSGLDTTQKCLAINQNIAVESENKHSSRITVPNEKNSKDLEICRQKLLRSEERLKDSAKFAVAQKAKNELKLEEIENKLKNCRNENIFNKDSFQSINVNINNRKSIKGLKVEEETYIPFSFIKKYFEVQGKYTNNEKTSFEWKHSNVKQEKLKSYSPTGIYVIGNSKATVAFRNKVKCIEGIFEVPVSIQWSKNGYFYPIQIAQFGLAHYSVLKAANSSEKADYKEKISLKKWKTLPGSKSEKVVDETKQRKVLSFDTTGGHTRDGQVYQLLEKSAQKSKVISFNIKFASAGMITITVAGTDKNIYKLNYVTDKQLLWYKHPNIYHGIDACNDWRRITRDLNVDLVKGLGFSKNKKSRDTAVELESVHKITLYGLGRIDDVVLSSSAHDVMFLKAADWLIRFQDKKGGWPVNVTRRLKGVSVRPGWYSAMGQGQAISLLCRAYNFTNKKKYLDAALKATELFKVPVEDGGIVSRVMGDNKMYEEYPTIPSFHVLNGFIFSLVGLYDLSHLSATHVTAEKLFQQGFETLLRILPLYDSGHETFYDLGHIVMPGHTPNRARWDYHVVHLKQLQLLMQIKPHKIIDRILQRWVGYASGVIAPHN